MVLPKKDVAKPPKAYQIPLFKAVCDNVALGTFNDAKIAHPAQAAYFGALNLLAYGRLLTTGSGGISSWCRRSVRGRFTRTTGSCKRLGSLMNDEGLIDWHRSSMRRPPTVSVTLATSSSSVLPTDYNLTSLIPGTDLVPFHQSSPAVSGMFQRPSDDSVLPGSLSLVIANPWVGDIFGDKKEHDGQLHLRPDAVPRVDVNDVLRRVQGDRWSHNVACGFEPDRELHGL